jgi:Fe-S cluster assembly scaffold protein SufB
LKLVRQGREILLRNGIVSSINKQVRGGVRVPMYTLGITGGFMEKFGEIVDIKIPRNMNGKKRASMFGIDDKFAYLPIKSIEFKDVENLPVYNFGVEEHETYTANAVAVHNCSAPQYTKSSLHAGCVEIHVLKGARARYSSIENWSRNTFNLNTKRAVVAEDGIIEWVNGNMGSGCTMLYPASLLIGDRSKSNFMGKNTSSTIVSKSISKNGGITSYRGQLSVRPSATGTKSSVECDALMIDNISQSNTYPYIDCKTKDADIAHEATVGKISEEQIFYLMSRGLSEEEAVGMIVSGFIEPIVKELPLEYAVELNRLIELEMEGTLG